MKSYNLLHFGIGTIGKAFLQQLQENKKNFERKFALTLPYCGFFTSKGGAVYPEGFSTAQISQLIQQFTAGVDPRAFSTFSASPFDFLNRADTNFFKNTIIVDTTTASTLYPFILQAMEQGAHVVAANKRLLTSPFREFQKLNSFGAKQLMHETTVGAGLPVISTLKSLLATGDEVREISGCMSGTLGFICSELENGMSFSESVQKAKVLGYTESDPRADLSGEDVARKALILARLLGQTKELTDIAVEAWYPKTLADSTVSAFMKRIQQLDSGYKEKMQKAQKKGNTLRYVAKITKTACTVDLREVSKQSALGSLEGADNMYVFKTKRYSDRLLIVQGPGAGPAVTAAGVMADILSIAGVW